MKQKHFFLNSRVCDVILFHEFEKKKDVECRRPLRLGEGFDPLLSRPLAVSFLRLLMRDATGWFIWRLRSHRYCFYLSPPVPYWTQHYKALTSYIFLGVSLFSLTGLKVEAEKICYDSVDKHDFCRLCTFSKEATSGNNFNRWPAPFFCSFLPKE